MKLKLYGTNIPLVQEGQVHKIVNARVHSIQEKIFIK